MRAPGPCAKVLAGVIGLRASRAERCVSCHRKVGRERLCPACGLPTRLASDDERAAWELAQWRLAHGRGVGQSGAILPARPKGILGRGREVRGESIEIDLRPSAAAVTVRGTTGLRRATLVVDRATVSLAPHRLRRTRWIPLEEVVSVRCTGKALVVESPVERIRLKHHDPAVLERAAAVVSAAVAEAHVGRRHDPDVTQAWCELISDLWKAPLGRARITARKAGPLV